MPAKPSLKDRLGLNRPPPEDGEPDRTTAPIRGIKRRLNASTVEVPPLGEAPMAQASSSSSSMANRPYGSITRRIAQMSTPASTTGSSAACASALPLLSLLKQDWAAGKIPSWKVAAYAEAVAKGGITSLAGLASVGSKGKWKSNAQRDLMRCWGKPAGAPHFFWAAIPVKDSDGNPAVEQHPFILPHELLSRLYAENQELFQKSLGGQEVQRLLFWDNMNHVVDSHPTLSQEGLAKCIPLGIHGDGGSFNKQDQLTVLTFNSLVGEGVTKQTRFLITLVKKSKMLDDNSTLDAIFRIIAWSMNSLSVGRFPTTGPSGEVLEGGGGLLAEGWSGTCLQVRGDWAFYSSAFGLPHWRSDENCCWLCRANNKDPGMFWTDFNSSAGWRSALWSHEDYIAHLESQGKCCPEIFEIVGLRLDMIVPDVLHAIDLGVSAHIVANVFWELLPQFGRNQSEQVKALQQLIKAFYSRNRVASRMEGRLTLDRIRTMSSWPKLKAKAAAVRNLVPFAAELAAQYNSGSLHDKRRLALANDLHEFYTLLGNEGRFFSASALASVQRLGNSVPILYAHLAAEAFHSGTKAWKLVPKFHLYQHLCLYQAAFHGNPRFYWTYADEDMVGAMVEVAQSCHPSTMAPIAMFKWLVLQFQQ